MFPFLVSHFFLFLSIPHFLIFLIFFSEATPPPFYIFFLKGGWCKILFSSLRFFVLFHLFLHFPPIKVKIIQSWLNVVLYSGHVNIITAETYTLEEQAVALTGGVDKNLRFFLNKPNPIVHRSGILEKKSKNEERKKIIQEKLLKV